MNEDETNEDETNEEPAAEKIPRIREESLCPCKSRVKYAECCMPLHYGRKTAETAEQLMRARYSAYFFRRAEYLVDTTHPDTREPSLLKDLEESLPAYRWSFLTILNTSKGGKEDKVGKVEFIAEYYLDDELLKIQERSRFKRHKGVWKYLDDKG
jgi:SEC-C motif-containing protein